MTDKIGSKECASAIIFMMLPNLVLSTVGNGISRLGSGYWINYIINFLPVILFLKPIKKYFYIEKENNNFDTLTNLIYLVFILLFSFSNFEICTDALFASTTNVYTREITAFLPALTAAVCAATGIEGLTRCSYISFMITCAIIFLMCVITFEGINVENIYPIFGNSINSVFTDFNSLGIYAGAASVFMLNENFKHKEDSYKTLKRSLISVFVFGLIIVFLCILSVPYPMGDLYDFSLAGIFSIAKSGSFFHRFEILLVFILVIISTLSAAFGLYLSGKTISKITNANDYRPFSIILAAVFFYLKQIYNITDIYNIVLYISASLLVLIFIIKSFIIAKKDSRGNV